MAQVTVEHARPARVRLDSTLMETETLVAIVAAIGAVVAAVVSGVSAQWVGRRRGEIDTQIATLNQVAQLDAAREAAEGQRDSAATAAGIQRELRAEERRTEFDAIVARYRGPLLHAAFDLQSRLWNILCRGFVQTFHANGTDRQKKYVVDNTLFVIGQYFCWIEIIRREVQFLDIGDETTDLSKLRNRIYYLWQTSNLPRPFMVWAGEQRAIGESMILERQTGPDCMGYAAFMSALQAGDIPLLDHLRRDIELLAADPEHGRSRLEVIQGELVQLLELLDPDYCFFPAEERTLAASDGSESQDGQATGCA